MKNKDVSGDESDGFPKIAHKEMDLHNNEVGRYIGEENGNASEDELADIIIRIFIQSLLNLYGCMINKNSKIINGMSLFVLLFFSIA